MKVETYKEIENLVNSNENDTALSLAFKTAVTSGKLDEKHKKGYVPDPIEKVVTWLDETYDELKVFVPFRFWNSPVLDKQWLNANRDEIEIKFATGGVFIRLDDMKRYLDHSIKARYSKDLLDSWAKRYDTLSEDEAIKFGFGSLEDDDPYVKAFGDAEVKIRKSCAYTTRRPVELIDNGTAVCMSTLTKAKYRPDFNELKQSVNDKKTLMVVEGGYLEDRTRSVYKVDKRYNFVRVHLLGDVDGSHCNLRRHVEVSKEERDRMVAEFLARKNMKGGC